MENESKKCDCGCNCGEDYKCKCHHTKKGQIILTSLLIIIVGAIVIVSILRDRIVNQNQFQISVIGQGKVSYTPDTANITLGVQVDKIYKAEDALNQLNGKMNKIIEVVSNLGIDKNDIKTQNYSLSANYDYISGVSRVSGYNANQAVIIKIKDIQNNQDLVSKVISEATKVGANQVNGVTFENSNIDSLKQEARIKAIANAREKSKEIQSALGLMFGQIVGMWENYISRVPEPIYGDYGKGGALGTSSVMPTLPSGTQDVVVEVNLSYKIK